MKEQLRKIPKRYPMNGTFELTVRCDLSCKMCLFRHDDSENETIREKEMTAAQWIAMAKQAARAGTVNLLVTGGEPMIRRDFCEIWEGIYQQGFFLTLYTNATMVTSEIMKTLRKYPPHKIGVSVYGASRETYQKVCGSGAALEKALAGIHELLTLPSVMEFRTTIIKDNYEEVDAIQKMIQEEFGEQYVLTHTRTVMQSVRGACADVNKCRLDPSENIKLYFHREFQEMEKIIGPDFRPEQAKFFIQKKDQETLEKQRLTLFYCNAGMTDYTITYDGKLQGCQILEVFHTEPLKEGFQKAWKRFPDIVKLPGEPEKCRKCRKKIFCSTCFGMRYAETGQLDGIPEYACEDARELAHMSLEYDKGGKGNEKISCT